MRKLHVIRMSSREYRDSYLKSPLWLSLRDKIIKRDPICVKCEKSLSSDVHHMNYRNIVNVKDSDLVGICRPCHDFIENCKRIGILPKTHNLNLLKAISPETITQIRKRKLAKGELTEDLMIKVCQAAPNTKRFICGIMKMSPPRNFMEWVGIKVTQSKIDHIIWTLNKFDGKRKDVGWLNRKAPGKIVGDHYHFTDPHKKY